MTSLIHRSLSCLQSVQSGSCQHNYPAYYYDRQSAICKPFVWSGCDGNSNRFLTLQQCEQTCYIYRDIIGMKYITTIDTVF